MSYQTRRIDKPHGHVSIVISSHEDHYSVNMDQHGGISIYPLYKHCSDKERPEHQRCLGYIYSDVGAVVHRVWGELIEERKQRRIDMVVAEELRRRTDTTKEYYGVKVDLSCAEVYDLFGKCEWRIADKASTWGAYSVLEVLFNGTWMDVSRTDLKDDVCVVHEVSKDDLDPRIHCRDMVFYGARIRDSGSLSIITHYSDG